MPTCRLSLSPNGFVAADHNSLYERNVAVKRMFLCSTMLAYLTHLKTDKHFVINKPFLSFLCVVPYTSCMTNFDKFFLFSDTMDEPSTKKKCCRTASGITRIGELTVYESHKLSSHGDFGQVFRGLLRDSSLPVIVD